MKRTHDYHEFLIKSLKNPIHAAEYLNAALEEGDKEMFLVALRNVAEAQHAAARCLFGRAKYFQSILDERPLAVVAPCGRVVRTGGSAVC